MELKYSNSFIKCCAFWFDNILPDIKCRVLIDICDRMLTDAVTIHTGSEFEWIENSIYR